MSLADRLEHIKRRLIHIAESSYKEKWISEEEYNNIRIKVDNEKITIGVVGQIKSGKSTFLNALIFGSEVLSTDVNPETATLTYIQYSNNPEAIVTFYNHEDIEEIKKFSKQSTIDFPEVSAAKKLMQAYQANKGEYENLIGSQKAVSLQKLKEYTSKNGKFIIKTHRNPTLAQALIYQAPIIKPSNIESFQSAISGMSPDGLCHCGSAPLRVTGSSEGWKKANL